MSQWDWKQIGLTVLSGGALAPVFMGMGASIVIEGAITVASGGNFWSGFTMAHYGEEFFH